MGQVITGLCSITIAASTTRYLGPMGLMATPKTTHDLACQIIPTAGTISLLAFKSIGGSPAATATATLYINGSATSLTCTTSTTAVGRDSINTVNVSAGDTISIEISLAAGATARAYTYSIVFTPSISTESILLGSSDAATPTNNQFVGIANSITPNTTENSVRLVIPEASGVFQKLYVKVDSPTNTGSIAFRVYNNTAAGNTVATIVSGALTATDTSNSDTVAAAGNVASLRVTTTGPATMSAFHYGLVYTSPSGSGYFLILGSTGVNVMTNAGTRYDLAAGHRAVTTNESVVQNLSNEFTAKQLYSRIATAPGAGAGWNIFLRSGSANTALQNVITGASQITASTIADVPIQLDTLINVSQEVASGAPVGSTWKWGLLGYLAHPTSSNTSNFFLLF